MICTPHPVFFGDQSEKNEMFGAYRAYGEEERCIQGLVWKSERRDRLEDPGVDGRRILRWIFKKVEMMTWTGSVCLRRSIDGGHL